MVKVSLFLVPVVALLIAIFYVLSNDQNEAILAMDFNLFGYAFSVMQVMGGAIILSALLPTLYFTFSMLKMGFLHGKERREVKLKDNNIATLDEVRDQLMHGQFEAGLAKLDKSKAHDPTLRGQLLLKLGRLEEAQTEWRQAFDQGSLVCGYLLADSMLENDQSPARVFTDIINAAPKEATRAYAWLLPHLLDAGDDTQAASIAKTARDAGYTGPDEVMAAIRIAELRQMEKGDRGQAIEGYRVLAKKNPTSVDAHLRLAALWEAEGQPVKANKALRTGLTQTGNPRIADALDSMEREQGQPGKASDFFEDVVAKQPEFAGQFHLWKVCKFLREGLLEDAKHSLRAAMSSRADKQTVAVLGAEIAEREGDHAAANAYYREALVAAGLLTLAPGQPLSEAEVAGTEVAVHQENPINSGV